MSASPQVRRTDARCRWLLPAGRGCAYAAAAVAIATVVAFAGAGRSDLSPVELGLVGRWLTDHGDVDTTLELRADRSVEVAQVIILAQPGGEPRVIGPTVTTGRWRVVAGRLHIETTSPRLVQSPWQKLRTLVRTRRWPARGDLHRTWELRTLTADRFAFVDRGNGGRGHARRDQGLAPGATLLAVSGAGDMP